MADKAKFYTRKKTIEGVEYTAQFNGLSASARAVDGSYISVDGTTTLGVEKFNTYILEHVIVEPSGLTMDDFEDMETLNAVVKFGREVMQGKFRNAEDKSDAKKPS